MKHYQNYFRELPDGSEIEIEIEYTASPYIPATLYGDNSFPAEGGEIEILRVWTEAEGWEGTWTDLEDQKWNDYLVEHHEDEDHDYD